MKSPTTTAYRNLAGRDRLLRLLLGLAMVALGTSAVAVPTRTTAETSRWPPQEPT